jgi:LMBR1 domain-containing protein 1
MPTIATKADPRPLSYFLNTFFASVSPIPVVGITLYGVFVFWLMACVIKGITKMGVRFLFISVHPIK